MTFRRELAPNESGPNLRLVEDNEVAEAHFNRATDALVKGKITKEEADQCSKAEIKYGVARKKFIEAYNAIKHEKVAHNSANLRDVVNNANEAKNVYLNSVGDMNRLFSSFNIKERNVEDGSLFDDEVKFTELESEMSELGIQDARDAITSTPEIHLASDEDDPAKSA